MITFRPPVTLWHLIAAYADVLARQADRERKSRYDCPSLPIGEVQ